MIAARSALLGARVRRVDAPAEDLLAIGLHSPAWRGVLLCGLAPAARGFGLCERRPGASVQSPFLQRLKSALEGGRICAIEQPHRVITRLHVERSGERTLLDLELRGTRGNAVLRGADGSVLSSMHALGAPLEPEPVEASGALDVEIDALHAAGARLLAAHAEHAIERLRADFSRRLKAQRRRTERRLSAIESDIARAASAAELRRHASLLLMSLHELPRGCAQVEVVDPEADPPARITLEIDPALGPGRQADAWFTRARKLERGAAIAAERARLARRELASCDEALAKVAAARSLEQLQATAPAGEPQNEARPSRKGKSKADKGKAERLPYRKFVGSGGRAILVGRGAADNDRLTLDHARPHDLWLHARDDAGAHVIVPLERDEACSPELLCDAATLAAHFSQARGEARVDVLYTPRRYVAKPRKAEPGRMRVTSEKVFQLRLEAPRLRRLLASERD
jgi:predicted ribosome quality control (RQC) complex YloA/Tae2 family protein